MIRDFSEEAKQTICDQIDTISPQDSFQFIWDNIRDMEYAARRWIGELSIENYLNDVDNYHRMVLDEKDTDKVKIDRIFTNVQAVEEKYAIRMEEIAQCLNEKVRVINKMAEIMTISDTESFAKELPSLKVLLQDSKLKDTRLLINQYTQGIVEYFTDDQKAKLEEYAKELVQDLGRDVGQLNETDKKEQQMLVVDIYNVLEPELSKKWEEFFDSANNAVAMAETIIVEKETDVISEFDRYNIMYIVYTADEPFKELFLGTMGMYEIGNVHFIKSCYSFDGQNEPYIEENTINFKREHKFYYDAKGPYNTFFHECGHAIDYQIGNGRAYSMEYMDGSNYDVICSDVYTRIEAEAYAYLDKRKEKFSSDEKIEICESVMAYFKNVSGEVMHTQGIEYVTYCAVKNKINAQLSKIGSYKAYDLENKMMCVDNRVGISDIYGGVTNNILIGGWKHETIDEETQKNNYWYNVNPPYEPTGKQEKEMWAHYFSYGITGNKEAEDDMRNFLEQTMKQYDAMAEKMTEGL